MRRLTGAGPDGMDGTDTLAPFRAQFFLRPLRAQPASDNPHAEDADSNFPAELPEGAAEAEGGGLSLVIAWQRLEAAAAFDEATAIVTARRPRGVALLPRLALPPIDYCVTADEATAAVESSCATPGAGPSVSTSRRPRTR